MRVTNPVELKNFVIKYMGKILPTTIAESFKNDLECIDITHETYNKIMSQWQSVKREKLKLDGGSLFRRKRTKKKRKKRNKKSSKRRTKKNQKGGDPFTFIGYSFATLSFLSIAIPIIIYPFILVNNCLQSIEKKRARELALLKKREMIKRRRQEREEREEREQQVIRKRRNRSRRGERGERRDGILHVKEMTAPELAEQRRKNAVEKGLVVDLTNKNS